MRGFLFTLSHLGADNTHFFLVHASRADDTRDEKTTDHMIHEVGMESTTTSVSSSSSSSSTDSLFYTAALATASSSSTSTPSSSSSSSSTLPGAGSKENFINVNITSRPPPPLLQDTMMSRLLWRERKKRFEAEKDAHVPPVDHHTLAKSKDLDEEEEVSFRSKDEEPAESSEESLRALRNLLEDVEESSETPPDDNNDAVPNRKQDRRLQDVHDPRRSVGSEVVYEPVPEAQSRPPAPLSAPPMRVEHAAPVDQDRVAGSSGHYPAVPYDAYPQRASYPGLTTGGLYSSNPDRGPPGPYVSRPSSPIAPPMQTALDAPTDSERVDHSPGQSYPGRPRDEYPQRASYPGFATGGLRYSSNPNMGSAASASYETRPSSSSSIVGEPTLCIHLWTVGGSLGGSSLGANGRRSSAGSIARSFGLYGNTAEHPLEYHAYHGVGEYLKKSSLRFENGYWVVGPRLAYVSRPGNVNGEEIVDTTCRSLYYDLIQEGETPHDWTCDPAIRYDMLNQAIVTEQFLSRQEPCDQGNQFDMMAERGGHVLGSAHVEVKQQLLQHPAFKLYVHLAIGDTKLVIRDPQRDTYLKLSGGRSVYDADSGAIIVNKDVPAGEQIDEIIFELSKLHNRGMFNMCDRRLAQNTLLASEFGVCSSLAECDAHLTYLRTIVDRMNLGIEVPQSAKATYAWFENADAEIVTYEPGHMTRMLTEDGKLSYEGKRIRVNPADGRIPDKLMRLIQRFLTTPHDKNGGFPLILPTPILYAFVQYTKMGPQEILNLLNRVFRAEAFTEAQRHLEEDGEFVKWVRDEFPKVKVLEKAAAYNQIILTLSQLVGVGKSCETTQKLKGLEVSPELRDHAEQMKKNKGGPIMPQYSKAPCGISSTPLASSNQNPAPGPNSSCIVGTRPWKIGPTTCCSCTHLAVAICHECNESMGSSQGGSPYGRTETQVSSSASTIPWSGSPPPLGDQPMSHPDDIQQLVIFSTTPPPPVVPYREEPVRSSYQNYQPYISAPAYEERPTVAPHREEPVRSSYQQNSARFPSPPAYEAPTESITVDPPFAGGARQAYDLTRSPQSPQSRLPRPQNRLPRPRPNQYTATYNLNRLPRPNKVLRRRPIWTPSQVGTPFTVHETTARAYWQEQHDRYIQREEQRQGVGSRRLKLLSTESGIRALLVAPSNGASRPEVGQWSSPLDVDDYSHRSNYFFQNATLMNAAKAENFEDFILLNTLLTIVPRAVFYPCISSPGGDLNPSLGKSRNRNKQKGGLKNQLKNGLANGAKDVAKGLTDFGFHLGKQTLKHVAENNQGQLEGAFAKAGSKAFGEIIHRRNARERTKRPRGSRGSRGSTSRGADSSGSGRPMLHPGSGGRTTNRESGSFPRSTVPSSSPYSPDHPERGQMPSYDPAQEQGGRGSEYEHEDDYYEDSTPDRRPSSVLAGGTPGSREADHLGPWSGRREDSPSMPRSSLQLDDGRRTQVGRPYAPAMIEEEDMRNQYEPSPPSYRAPAQPEHGIGEYNNAQDRSSSSSYDMMREQSDFREPSGRTGYDEHEPMDQGFGGGISGGRERPSSVAQPPFANPRSSELGPDPLVYDARSGYPSMQDPVPAYGGRPYDERPYEGGNGNPGGSIPGGAYNTQSSSSSSTFDYNTPSNYNRISPPNRNQNNGLSVYQQLNGGHQSRAENTRAGIRSGDTGFPNTNTNKLRLAREENTRRRRERAQEEREEQAREQARMREQERRRRPNSSFPGAYGADPAGGPSSLPFVPQQNEQHPQMNNGYAPGGYDSAYPSRTSENSSPFNPSYARSGNYAPSAPPMNGATLGSPNTFYDVSFDYGLARAGKYMGMIEFTENKNLCHWVLGYRPRGPNSTITYTAWGITKIYRTFDCTHMRQCQNKLFVPVSLDNSSCGPEGGFAVHCCPFNSLSLKPMYQGINIQ